MMRLPQEAVPNSARFMECASPLALCFTFLFRLLLISFLTPFTTTTAAPRDANYSDTTGEGLALVKDVLSRRPAEDSQILGLLKILPPEGRTLEVPIKMTIRIGTNLWHDMYQAQPAGGKLGEVLVIEHRAGQTNRYLHATFEDPAKEPVLKPLAATDLFKPFANSDFFPADLGLEFLHWPSQKIVKKEMRKGRSCRVVESTHPNRPPGAYSRVLSWLDFETGNIIRAEGFDEQDRKLKEFSVRKISRSEGKAQLKEIEIRNDQTDARTRLEFNLEIEE